MYVLSILDDKLVGVFRVFCMSFGVFYVVLVIRKVDLAQNIIDLFILQSNGIFVSMVIVLFKRVYYLSSNTVQSWAVRHGALC